MQEHGSRRTDDVVLEWHDFTRQAWHFRLRDVVARDLWQGAPVIAIHTEYDANPSNSQRSGASRPAGSSPAHRDIARDTAPMRR